MAHVPVIGAEMRWAANLYRQFDETCWGLPLASNTCQSRQLFIGSKNHMQRHNRHQVQAKSVAYEGKIAGYRHKMRR